MDIERVNDYTLKLYISYDDIEERGYSREEIWYNRGKGEQLFWDMIEEIGEEADFELEGAVWIHVNAAETGIEVVVTRTSTKDDANSASNDLQGNPFGFEKFMEEVMDPEFDGTPFKPTNEDLLKTQDHVVFSLQSFDDVVAIAKRLENRQLTTTLYKWEGNYYFSLDVPNDDYAVTLNLIAIINEHAALSQLTKHRLAEYGETVMDGNCVETVLKYFV